MENKIDPLSSIGLCFSGGGYRAAAFSLGVLSYLNKIKYNEMPLILKLEALSTVSGGTITGVYYALSNYKKIPFEEFYTTFYNFLNNDLLLDTALKKLKDDKLWKNNHKNRSLINAFALAYHEILKLGSFEDFEKETNPNLKDVCFNATDFAYGLAFRFQNSGNFGNKPLYNAPLNKLKGKVRLADVIASSSCFPFCFEPMIFPDDYFDDHNAIDYKELKQKEKYRFGIGLMDGGIVDNQGIGSMVNIDKRRKDNALSAIIVCDVGSYKMDQWLKAEKRFDDEKKGITINHTITKILRFLNFHWYYWAITLAGVLLIGLNSMHILFGKPWVYLYVAGGFLIGVGIVLMLIGTFTSLFRIWIKVFFSNLYQKNIPKVLVEDVATFKHLDIALVKRMLIDRLTSAVTMISDVFLNQIRRLNYKLLYEKKEYKDRAITTTVYQLNGVKATLGVSFKPNPKILPHPTKKINESSLIASEMPTTLWWDGDDRNVNRLDNLIAAGQFTTCYNIMDYILKLKNKGITSAVLETLFNDLQKDWRLLNDTPLFFVNKSDKIEPQRHEE